MSVRVICGNENRRVPQGGLAVTVSFVQIQFGFALFNVLLGQLQDSHGLRQLAAG